MQGAASAAVAGGRIRTVAVPAAVLVVAEAIPVAARSRLPDPLATRWALEGQPNGHLRPGTFLLVVLGAWLIVWVTFFVLPGRVRSGRFLHVPSARLASTGGCGALGLVVGISVATTSANLDTERWWLSDGSSVLSMLLGCAVAGLVLGFASRPRGPDPE